jgi:hypothetical protein
MHGVKRIDQCPRCNQWSVEVRPPQTYDDRGMDQRRCVTVGCGWSEEAGEVVS